MKPLMKLSKALAPRKPAATTGTLGADVTNAAMVATFVAKSPLLMIWRPGRARGLEDIFPASLKKATMDPVNVTPPIKPSSTSIENTSCIRHTNEHTEVGSDEVQSRCMTNVCEHTRNTCQYGRQTHDGVQGRNHLRQLDGGDAATNDSTSQASQSRDTSELHECLYGEADCRQGREDTGANAEHSEYVALTSSSLRRKSGYRTCGAGIN